MRSSSMCFLVVLCTGAAILTACEKDAPATQNVTTPPNPVSNITPAAFAGRDIWVMLPSSTATLSGGASTMGRIDKWQWRQVIGPRSSILENPDSSRTKVSNLEKGKYAFELSVTDQGGLSGKDTVVLSVMEPVPSSHGELIFNDLQLSCPMGCHLWIDCIYCRVPVNQPLKVYLREDNSNPWIEVVPESQWTANDKYSYQLDNGNLVIYTNDEPNGTVDVKFTY